MLAWRLMAIYGILSNAVTTIALSAVQTPYSQLISTVLQNPSSGDLWLLNKSTALTEGKIDCSESRFGHPPAESCHEAIRLIMKNPLTLPVRRAWGPRNTAGVDSPMPKQWISCEPSSSMKICCG